MQHDQRFDPKSNSIGILRLLLAVIVVSWHCQVVGHVGYDPIDLLSHQRYSTGAMAVDGFFAFSGFLITASFIRLNSLKAFLWHRVLRIFPAYWVCLLLSTITLPLIFGVQIDWTYLWANAFEVALATLRPILRQVFKFTGDYPILMQIVGGEDAIPGVFETNNFTQDINGSLWTLHFEFRLYVVVGLLGVIGLLRKWLILLVVAISWAGFIYLFATLPPGNAHALAWPRTTVHFFLGMAVYLYQPRFQTRWAVLLAILAIVSIHFDVYAVIGPLAVTYGMFWLARVLPFQNTFKNRDYSYGVYIYSFPVQQLLTHWGINNHGFAVYFPLSVVASMVLAITSWHLIEKPALMLKNLISSGHQHAKQ